MNLTGCTIKQALLEITSLLDHAETYVANQHDMVTIPMDDAVEIIDYLSKLAGQPVDWAARE